MQAWIVGNGADINFWKGRWLKDADIVVDLLNILADMQHYLSAKDQDFIVNGNWFLPQVLHENFPTIRANEKGSHSFGGLS